MIDEFGEGLYPDLLHYYDVNLVDVISGSGPSPSLVSLLVRRLPDTSLTAALARGGREFFGWGMDRHMMADAYDALNQNTRATGQWKSKPPTFPEYPRPKKKSDKPATVADLFGIFQTRALNSANARSE